MAKLSSGLVLGKFMPLHQGHELLISFASHFVDNLFIVVDHIPEAEIEGQLRVAWLKQSFPKANVLYLPAPNPQSPEEHPDFWTIWKDSLLALLPQKPDYLFASEEYGLQLATVLGTTFMPFDLGRETIPISGSIIRQNPWAHWDFLSNPAKAFYLKRICIFGPESTGKSTLSQSLAHYFNTHWVPEYARRFIEMNKSINQGDMLTIVQGQIALENTIAPLANKILFCDTSPLATLLWSHWLFDSCCDELHQLANRQSHDLYLLMYPDLDWQADPVRYLPDQSHSFFEDCKELLKNKGLPYIVITGQGKDRLNSAIEQLRNYFSWLN